LAQWRWHTEEISQNFGCGQAFPMSKVEPVDATHDKLKRLRACKLWKKLKNGDMHEVTMAEVEELHSCLDDEDMGEVTLEQLGALRQIEELKLNDDDIFELMKECDTDGSSNVNVKELYKALTLGSVAAKLVLDRLKGVTTLHADECSRQDLVDFMTDHHEVESSLWSLPQTMVLFLVFTVSVMNHTRVDLAFEMQQALEDSVLGEGGPFLDKYVHDFPSLWDWMDTSFRSVHLKNDLDNWPYPGRMESYNQIIGGVLFLKQDYMPGPCDQVKPEVAKIYESQRGECSYSGMGDVVEDPRYILYHEDEADIGEKFKQWRKDNWLGANTSTLDIKALFFNAHFNMFTDYTLRITMEDTWGRKDGLIHFGFYQESYLAEPYFNKLHYMCDFIFVFIVFRMFTGELGEMIPAAMNGLDGFQDYWDIWNAIDWMSMLLGLLLSFYWIWVAVDIEWALREEIGKLPSAQLDQEVLMNKTFFSTEALDFRINRKQVESQISSVLDTSGFIASRHGDIRSLVFWNSVFLMLKFFKAFRANPRLNVVIETLSACAVDFVHFSVVLLVVMLVFATMGYIKFGTFVKEFSSFEQSFLMCWRILMGDDNSADLQNTGEEEYIFYAFFWYVTYQAFVVIILMNMTVAIVMDAYTQVNNPNARTMWEQMRVSLKELRETKGFINMWYLVCEFNDDDDPAHPGLTCTSRSLRRAFENDKMSKAQASWLVKEAQKYVQEKNEENQTSLTDALKMIAQVRTESRKTQDMCKSMYLILKSHEDAPKEARYDAIWQGHNPDQMPAMPRTAMASTQSSFMSSPPAQQQQSMGALPSLNVPMQAVDSSASRTASDFGGRPALADDGFASVPSLDRQVSTDFRMPAVGGQANSGAGGAAASQQQLAKIQEQLGQLGMFSQAMFGQMQVQMMQLQAAQETVRSEIVKNADSMTKQMLHFQEHLEKVDMRTDRIDRNVGTVRNSLSDADFDQINRMPQKVVDAVSVAVARAMHNPHCSPLQSGEPLRNTPQFKDKQFEVKVNELSTQVADVLNVVQRQQEMLNMLWRIDAGVRELRHGGSSHHAYDENGCSPGRPHRPSALQPDLPTGSKGSSHEDSAQTSSRPSALNDTRHTPKRSGVASGAVISKPPHGQ
jgi:hypothetical protein